MTSTSIECPTNGSPTCLGKGVVTLYKCDCPEQPAPPVAPHVLTADLDLYVSPQGSDQNDGLSKETPLKTIKAALEKTKVYSRNGFLITINLAGGTYAEPERVFIDFRKHYPRLALKGDGTMPVIENVVCAMYYGHLLIDGVQVKQSTYTDTLVAYYSATMEIKNCEVTTGKSGGEVVTAVYSGFIFISGRLQVKTTAPVAAMICSYLGGTISCADGATMRFDGQVTSGTAATRFDGRIYLLNSSTTPAITGVVTGPRYSVSTDGLISVMYSARTTLPGTTAGVAVTGGIYRAN